MKLQSFSSPLASGIQRFLEHKRALGRRFETEESALRLLDRYLVQRGVKRAGAITTKLLDDFLTSRPRRAPRSYNELVRILARLFVIIPKILPDNSANRPAGSGAGFFALSWD